MNQSVSSRGSDNVETLTGTGTSAALPPDKTYQWTMMMTFQLLLNIRIDLQLNNLARLDKTLLSNTAKWAFSKASLK